VSELGDDTLAVEKVTASSHLNTSIRKDFHRLCTVRVMIRECDLIVKCSGLELPLKSICACTLASHLVRPNLLKDTTKTLYVNLLDKAGYHSDGRNLHPRRSGLIGKSFSYLIKSQEIRETVVGD